MSTKGNEGPDRRRYRSELLRADVAARLGIDLGLVPGGGPVTWQLSIDGTRVAVTDEPMTNADAGRWARRTLGHDADVRFDATTATGTTPPGQCGAVVALDAWDTLTERCLAPTGHDGPCEPEPPARSELGGRPTITNPSSADPSSADPSSADPSSADPSSADPSIAGPSATGGWVR